MSEFDWRQWSDDHQSVNGKESYGYEADRGFFTNRSSEFSEAQRGQVAEKAYMEMPGLQCSNPLAAGRLKPGLTLCLKHGRGFRGTCQECHPISTGFWSAVKRFLGC